MNESLGGDGAEPGEPLEREIAQLIARVLRLDAATVAQLEMDTPLFEDGLGLDSIDALQIAVALERGYGARIRPDDASNREILRSVRSLASFVRSSRSGHA
jgi:acyl carrier protein